MQAAFWHEMWAGGVVGFHQQEINRFLRDFWPQLELDGQGQVLVPLCGKSLDMLWLRELGHDVLGVELSQKALHEFLAENALNAEPVQHENYCGYQLPQMTLLCGDFFQLTPQDCAQVKAVYDRASIIALPPEMRRDYAQHLQKILPLGTPFLMVIMEYDQSAMDGPPFSVKESEVRELFAEFTSIDVVDEEKFERKGNAVTEKVLLLRP
ncbi:thiopurine S-methyltransferase [Thiosulfatimonas sediminis]|uniref:Thiopurine S-methyltransferase n=1 Tax=Thiosulfatimonas sediminis TaxID=2675054 RepID=A0A6F8PT20_9GAMM|nr:thiopurine S-methyltransferase [Thiosulfatimonas sediminis]BBP45174.1 thiopurine S-methyltransferase [Thiosulfatimonas sediminis]